MRVDNPGSEQAGCEPEGRGQFTITGTPSTLKDPVRQPERVPELARDGVASFLAELERLRVGLWAQLCDGRERGGSSDPTTRLLTAPQVAMSLGVPVPYAYELVRIGRLRAARFGKYIGFAWRIVPDTARGRAIAGAK